MSNIRRLSDIVLSGSLTIHRSILENGLQIAVVVDSTTPIFSYQTWYCVGSADEPAGRQGLAHLFEHMMFRKTEKREMGEFEHEVNTNGGTAINAYTSRDQTVYFFTFPKEKLALAADLESDRMRRLVIDEEMFETEKGAVLTEKNRGMDDPVRFLWEELYKLAYIVHPYKYSTIGEFESIKAFSVEEAQQFYTRFYAPNNAMIIVVGDVDPDDCCRTIADYYDVFSPYKVGTRADVDESPQKEDRFLALEHPKAVKQLLAKAWHIPPMTHTDYPALAIAGRLLNSGKSAILRERLVNRSRVTELYVEAYSGRDVGTFEFFAQLSSGETPESIEKVVVEAITELAEGIISEEQIQIAKNRLQKEVYQAMTNPASLARLLGEGFILADDMAYQIEMLERIRSITPADVQRIVKQYILAMPATTIVVSPPQKETSIFP